MNQIVDWLETDPGIQQADQSRVLVSLVTTLALWILLSLQTKEH